MGCARDTGVYGARRHDERSKYPHAVLWDLLHRIGGSWVWGSGGVFTAGRPQRGRRGAEGGTPRALGGDAAE